METPAEQKPVNPSSRPVTPIWFFLLIIIGLIIVIAFGYLAYTTINSNENTEAIHVVAKVNKLEGIPNAEAIIKASHLKRFNAPRYDPVQVESRPDGKIRVMYPCCDLPYYILDSNAEYLCDIGGMPKHIPYPDECPDSIAIYDNGTYIDCSTYNTKTTPFYP